LSVDLAKRLEVLRDEALNASEHPDDPPGSEIFDAVVHRLAHFGETEPGIDLSLQDSLSRRLAWGESEATVLVDCDNVCKRLLAAAKRSFKDCEEAGKVIAVVTEVSCTAARHVAMAAVQRASKERASSRREEMIQRQLNTAIRQQQEIIRHFSGNNE
jgi:hypothetical protein